MKVLETHVVPPLQSSIRLSDYVAEIFVSTPSKKGMKKAIKKGLVSVDGKSAQTGNFLTGGEVITLHETVEIATPLDLTLEVLYEDAHLAVIFKPAGILVSGNKARTIVNALKQNLYESTEPDTLPTPLPAHRLDFPTSGLLLIGKTRSAHTALNQLFESKEIQKTYFAVVAGTLPKRGSMETPIAERPAISHYEVIKQVPSPKFKQLTLVQLKPLTGRRHQLRIHLAELGNPILGDKTYGDEASARFGKGLYLHAATISLVHPITKELLEITTDLPSKFMKLFPDN